MRSAVAMGFVLAIDQSTSGTKAVLYALDGGVIDRESVEHRQIYPRAGWVEHDGEEIWNNTVAVVRGLVERRAEVGELLCLSITNQRETFVVFDRETGRPLRNAIVWQCGRGEEICAQMRNAGLEEVVASRTGLKIDTYFSASKLAWLVRNEPEVGRRLRDGSALFGTIDTYLIYRLTRGRVFATDQTNASRTLLFDIGRLAWDEELCEMFQVSLGALAEVRDCSARFGETDVEGVLDEAVAICGVMGDSQAALFAQRCFEVGMAKVTVGTGSSVLLNVGEDPGRRSALARLEGEGTEGTVVTVGWVHGGEPVYCLEGIINYSAATIAWLKDQLGLIRDAGETESAARAVPDNGGVYLVPAFAGLGAPWWSAGARAAIVGMTGSTNRNHVIRAGLESIGYQVADVLEMMGEATKRRGDEATEGGVKLGVIHADGGATRNGFLMQFLADVTQREVVVSQVADCSPLGAAMAGMLGMGVYGGVGELAGLPREAEVYRPGMGAEEVRRLREGWRRAVGQVLAGVG
jgi:glycerol kinase